MARPIENRTGDTAQSLQETPICGLIMPISQMGDFDPTYWLDVQRILRRAVEAAGMRAQMVSDSLDNDIIHQRIVNNLYNNPVIICDVSQLNPNVMFELGMRLTFRKPTIIVTHDLKSLPFDTRVIEHVPYPSDLRFGHVEEFIVKLTGKIREALEKATAGTYKSFIESLGTFETVSPAQKEIPASEFIIERLDQLSNVVRRLQRDLDPSPSVRRGPRSVSFKVKGDYSAVITLDSKMESLASVEHVATSPPSEDGVATMRVYVKSEVPRTYVLERAFSMAAGLGLEIDAEV